MKKRSILMLLLTVLLAGCSTTHTKGKNVLNAPGYMCVDASSDRISAAVAYVATKSGAKKVHEKTEALNDFMMRVERRRYSYTTPDGDTVEIVSLLENGEPMRVFVSIDPKNETKSVMYWMIGTWNAQRCCGRPSKPVRIRLPRRTHWPRPR